MQAAAEAMGCRFVYAIVPEKRIEDVITAQARKKAMALVGTASTHMALESQTLPKDKIAQEVERLMREIAREMPPDFWIDK
jgi:predicted DNA-binding mobile mystery protein A